MRLCTIRIISKQETAPVYSDRLIKMTGEVHKTDIVLFVVLC